MDKLSNAQIVFRLLFAIVLSSAIGMERELRGRAAGLRTHVLVAVSSCLFMVVSIYVALAYGNLSDPSRIASGVVTGIGILCAGTIIRFGVSIKGLTTATSLWAVSALGLAVGAGLYFASCVTTVLILLTLLLFSRLERNISKTKKEVRHEEMGP